MESYERSNFKITSSIARGKINNQTSILTQNDDRKSNHFNYNIWVIPLGISKAFESIHTPCMHCRKMKFSIKDFFSKCDQIRSFLRIWSHLLKISLMENFILYVVMLHIMLILIHDLVLNVRLGKTTGEDILTKIGITQTDFLSALLFIFYLAKTINQLPD